MKKCTANCRKHKKAKPLLQRWGPETIGALELNMDSITQHIVFVNTEYLYIVKAAERGGKAGNI